jgi:hypothetical protein
MRYFDIKTKNRTGTPQQKTGQALPTKKQDRHSPSRIKDKLFRDIVKQLKRDSSVEV